MIRAVVSVFCRASRTAHVYLFAMFFILAGAALSFASESVVQDEAEDPVRFSLPRFLPEKAVYTVAYFEAGSYWEFDEIFAQLRQVVSQYDRSKKIFFADGYHFSPGWDAGPERYDALAASIMENPDIDMVVAMGTVASVALLKHNAPKKFVVCLDVVDPVQSGLVSRQTQQPVASNFVVDYVPHKWRRSITLLDILHHSTRMGTMATKTQEGLNYSNVNDLREVGRERGFEVVLFDGLDAAESVESCKRGIKNLIDQKIDALYVPAINCFDPQRGDPVQLYNMLHAHGVKTYAKDGRIPVSNGALIGISTLVYDTIGRYFAAALLRQAGLPQPEGLKGGLPFEPKIFLNAATARRLHIAIPVNLLTCVDGIYDDGLPEIRR